MSDKDASKDAPDEEEDWMSYANAGFGSTDYSLWDDAGEEAEMIEEPDWDGEDLQLDTGEEEIPAAPRPASTKATTYSRSSRLAPTTGARTRMRARIR